jgi:hypothetical protein
MFHPATVPTLLASLAVGAIVTKTCHEGGHALAALACGCRIREIRIMPGIQVYPSLKRAACRTVAIAYTEPSGPRRQGFVAFMGTGLTTLLAYLLLALLVWLRPSGYYRTFLAVMAVLAAWDMYSYSTLPLLGLRRFVVFGGSHAEPVHAMELMGIPKAPFLIAVAASFLVFHSLLVLILLLDRA